MDPRTALLDDTTPARTGVRLIVLRTPLRRGKLGDSKDRPAQALSGLKKSPSFAFWPSDFDRRCPAHNH